MTAASSGFTVRADAPLLRVPRPTGHIWARSPDSLHWQSPPGQSENAAYWLLARLQESE